MIKGLRAGAAVTAVAALFAFSPASFAGGGCNWSGCKNLNSTDYGRAKATNSTTVTATYLEVVGDSSSTVSVTAGGTGTVDAAAKGSFKSQSSMHGGSPGSHNASSSNTTHGGGMGHMGGSLSVSGSSSASASASGDGAASP